MRSYGGAKKATCPACGKIIPGPKANKRLWGGSVVREGSKVVCPHCNTTVVATEVHAERVAVLQYTLHVLQPLEVTAQQHYVKAAGRVCPNCASKDVSLLVGEPRFCADEEPPHITILRSCHKCDHRWADTYVLEGYIEE